MKGRCKTVVVRIHPGRRGLGHQRSSACKEEWKAEVAKTEDGGAGARIFSPRSKVDTSFHLRASSASGSRPTTGKCGQPRRTGERSIEERSLSIMKGERRQRSEEVSGRHLRRGGVHTDRSGGGEDSVDCQAGRREKEGAEGAFRKEKGSEAREGTKQRKPCRQEKQQRNFPHIS